jgi:hypothetical protein
MRKLTTFLLLFLTATVFGATSSKRILRVTQVSVTNHGSTLEIHAKGQASTPGWTSLALVKLSTSTKDELVYAFVGVPPTKVVPQQVVPVNAKVTFSGPRPKRVRVRSANNSKIATVPPKAQGKEDTSSTTTPAITVVGKLTPEGVECQALREDTTNKLFTLSGALKGFKTGDHVKVGGSIAEVSICQQGTTINVSSIVRQ